MSIQMQDYGISKIRIFLFFLLSISAGVLEGFSLAMFLPLLQFIESAQDLNSLSDNSTLWNYIILFFNFIGLKISLLSLSSLVVVLMLLRVVVVYLRQIYIAWFSQEIRHQTRSNLFDALISAKYELFDKISTGEVVNLASNETVRTSGYFASIFQVFSILMVLLAMFCVLLLVSWEMTLVVTVMMLIGGLVVFFTIRNSGKAGVDATFSNKKISIALIERLTSIRLLKLSGYELREKKWHRELSDQVKGHLFLLSKLNASIELIMEPIVIILGVGLVIFSTNYLSLSLAELGIFGVTILRILPYSKEFLKSWQSVQAGSGAMQAVNRLLTSARGELEGGFGSRVFETLKKGIEFKSVSYTYPSANKPALSLINVFIPAGKTTALVGKSGSGKSTFSDLLSGLRKHHVGEILFDDILINDYDLTSIRRCMSFVSQDTEILNDTVRNNLLFTSPNATDVEIYEALDLARAKDFCLSLPNGVDTILGERGAKLSGGERQRLSMARALLKKSSVLILDEPTSAIDSQTEKEIEDSLDFIRSEMNITVIIIAHRLSTIKNADQIIVFDKGVVMESGSHDELMHNDAWYVDMIKIQNL